MYTERVSLNSKDSQAEHVTDVFIRFSIQLVNDQEQQTTALTSHFRPECCEKREAIAHQQMWCGRGGGI